MVRVNKLKIFKRFRRRRSKYWNLGYKRKSSYKKKSRLRSSVFFKVFKYVIFGSIIFMIATIFFSNHIREFFVNIINTHRYVNKEKILSCNLVIPSYKKNKDIVGFVYRLEEDKQEIKDLYVVKIKKNTLFLPEFSSNNDLKIFHVPAKTWVSVYKTPFDIIELKTFYSVSKHLGQDFMHFSILQTVYNFGVMPNFVIFFNNKNILASNINIKASKDVISLIDKSQNINEVEPLSDTYKVLEDGSKVFYIRFKDFYISNKGLFVIEDIKNEQAFVEIYNATSLNGYASFIKHIFDSVGIEVSRVGTTKKNLFKEFADKNCNAVIFLPDDRFLLTTDFIKTVLKVSPDCVAHSRPQTLLTTADIVIILLEPIF